MSTGMLFAVAAEDDLGLDGRVGTDFECSPFYMLAEAEGGVVSGSLVVANPYFGAREPRLMLRFLRGLGANVIIAGRMRQRTIDMCHLSGIDVAIGITGTIEKVLSAYLRGEHAGVVLCAEGRRERNWEPTPQLEHRA